MIGSVMSWLSKPFRGGEEAGGDGEKAPEGEEGADQEQPEQDQEEKEEQVLTPDPPGGALNATVMYNIARPAVIST